MISIPLRRNKRLGISVILFVVENGASMELDNGARLQEASNFPN
jgi:hypothetical protein